MMNNKMKIFKNLDLLPNYLVLIIASFISIFPFLWMIIGATNKTVDIHMKKNKGKEFLIDKKLVMKPSESEKGLFSITLRYLTF